MYCPECGHKNSDEAIFCAECGTKIIDDKLVVENVSVGSTKKKGYITIGLVLVAIIGLLIAFLIAYHSLAYQRFCILFEMHLYKAAGQVYDKEETEDVYNKMEDYVSEKIRNTLFNYEHLNHTGYSWGTISETKGHDSALAKLNHYAETGMMADEFEEARDSVAVIWFYRNAINYADSKEYDKAVLYYSNIYKKGYYDQYLKSYSDSKWLFDYCGTEIESKYNEAIENAISYAKQEKSISYLKYVLAQMGDNHPLSSEVKCAIEELKNPPPTSYLNITCGTPKTDITGNVGLISLSIENKNSARIDYFYGKLCAGDSSEYSIDIYCRNIPPGKTEIELSTIDYPNMILKEGCTYDFKLEGLLFDDGKPYSADGYEGYNPLDDYSYIVIDN